MSFIYLFAGMALAAFLCQSLFGYYQIKHFNHVYQVLRQKGKVAIGRRAGKIQAGTIVMFAIDDTGKILDAHLMQGISVIARFKTLPDYIGEDLNFIDRYHPLVQKENKLTQLAMENAREIYLRVEMGNYEEEPSLSPLQKLSQGLSQVTTKIENKIKGRE